VERFRAVLVTAFVALALMINLNQSAVNEFIEQHKDSPQADSELLPIQDEENWLVIKVSFPDEPFPGEMLTRFFEGDHSAETYIDQMTGGRTTLNLTIIEDVWDSPFTEDHWGADTSEERDAGTGSGGASQLATNAISGLMSGIDASGWDLNNDGTIDRVLILHSGEAQELSGPSTAIWSHFSAFQDPLVVDSFTFEHYTMVSIHGGLGVLIHEMLHQMGAVDLYDVHSDTPTRNWHGLGDWGIMASGNWNGEGALPSMPGAATLDLIGAVSDTEIDFYTNSTHVLSPISSGGMPLSIEIAPGEKIWISFRADVGFDAGLPGHGILVEHQDQNFGDFNSNLVNTDPKKAWDRVIEADADDSLLRARDYGSAGDVFKEGDLFGHDGLQIRDHRGRLVQWTIHVTNVSASTASIELISINPTSSIFLTPRSPVSLLPGEFGYVFATLTDDCLLMTNIDSGAESITSELLLERGEHQIAILDIDSISGRHGQLSGTIGCEGESPVDFNLEWFRIAHRVSNQTLEATIPWDEDSTVSLYPDYEGSGSRTYSITVDGAADRVASVASQGKLDSGDPIILDVSPSGLLEPGMIARGELVLIDSDKIEQRIPIVLQGDHSYPFSSTIEWMAIPSNALTLVCMLLALSIGTGGKRD